MRWRVSTIYSPFVFVVFNEFCFFFFGFLCLSLLLCLCFWFTPLHLSASVSFSQHFENVCFHRRRAVGSCIINCVLCLHFIPVDILITRLKCCLLLPTVWQRCSSAMSRVFPTSYAYVMGNPLRDQLHLFHSLLGTKIKQNPQWWISDWTPSGASPKILLSFQCLNFKTEILYSSYVCVWQEFPHCQPHTVFMFSYFCVGKSKGVSLNLSSNLNLLEQI